MYTLYIIICKLKRREAVSILYDAILNILCFEKVKLFFVSITNVIIYLIIYVITKAVYNAR